MTSYDVGDRIKVVTTFRDEDGVLLSPSTVVGDYRAPSDSTPTALTPTEDSEGVWEMTLPTFDEPGVWRWYIAGTAGLITADQGAIRVEPKGTGTP